MHGYTCWQWYLLYLAQIRSLLQGSRVGGWFRGDCSTLECLVMGMGNITLLGIKQIRLFILSFKWHYISMNVSVSYLVKVEVSQLEGTSVKCKANYLRREEGWEFFSTFCIIYFTSASKKKEYTGYDLTTFTLVLPFHLKQIYFGHIFLRNYS